MWDRRTFLKVVSGALTGSVMAGGGKYVFDSFAILHRDNFIVPDGKESFHYSSCKLCPGGCGLRVRRVDDRVITVTGLDTHPVNGQGLCPVGILNPVDLYHENRLRVPMKKTGGGFVPVDWSAVLSAVSKTAGRSGRWILVGPELSPAAAAMVSEAFSGLEVEHYLDIPYSPRRSRALTAMHGAEQEWTVDLDNARTLLFFGDSLLDGFASPPWISRAFGGKMPDEGTLLHFGQGSSATARKASFSLAPKAGSLGYAALGVAYTILNEHLYDDAFIAERTVGFREYRDFILRSFNLNQLGELTGLKVVDLIHMTRLLLREKRCVALWDDSLSTLENGEWQVSAIHALNALLGRINTAGGISVREDMEPFTAAGTSPRPFPAADPSRFEGASGVILFGDVRPWLTHPHLFDRALADVPVVLGVGTHRESWMEPCRFILPASHSMESINDVYSPPHFPHHSLSLTRPVLPGTKGVAKVGEVLAKIARAAGGRGSDDKWESRIRTTYGKLAGLRGYLFGSPEESLWQSTLSRSGFWSSPYSSESEFMEQAYEKGGWIRPVQFPIAWKRVLPAGRFDFRPMLRPEELVLSGMNNVWPLALVPVPFSTLSGKSRTLPYMPLLNYSHEDIRFAMPVVVHPETAEELELAMWEPVRIEYPDGDARGVLIASEHVRRDEAEVIFAPEDGSYFGEIYRWALRDDQSVRTLYRCRIVPMKGGAA